MLVVLGGFVRPGALTIQLVVMEGTDTLLGGVAVVHGSVLDCLGALIVELLVDAFLDCDEAMLVLQNFTVVLENINSCQEGRVVLELL